MRGGRVLFMLVFVSLFLVSFIVADSHEVEDANPDFDEDVELGSNAGTTPDSPFYFLDEFFDGFGSDLEIREEKIAEIKAMIQEGKIQEAKIALRKYKVHAENFEREVSPEEREEARRSASAIYNTLKEIEDEIPEEDRGEFFDDIVEREGGIITASEIAGKIKDLCQTLSDIDPLEYSRICKTGDDAPEWQKILDKDLTATQREEAKNFGKIMSQCFKTSGQECACDEIPFADFAEMCSIAAPLAVACDIEGNEEACEKMDNLEMPELPDHLQDVFDELERDIGDSQFELHMPFECREAGITNPRECMKLMVESNAPPECKQALLDANVQGEREGREICEKIMFELNAPPECIEAGLTDHKECGLFMFKQDAPSECIEAGLTGEYRDDPRKCDKIMRELDRSFDERGGPGGFFGRDCGRIENPKERLNCYDGATRGARDFDDRYREIKQEEKQCAQQCLSEGGAWDFSGGDCTCRFDNFRKDFDDRFKDNFRKDLNGEFRDNFRYDEEPRYDCSVIDCFDGQYCDPYQGCVFDRNDNPLYDCSVMFCVTGSYCDPYQGCVSDGGRSDDPNNGKYDCSQLNCGPGFFCNSLEGCYPDNSKDFNTKSNPDYDPTFGGDGVSCNEGYESDGQGGCIPFGTGDYGFDDPNSDSYSTDYDESPPPETEPEPEQESAPEQEEPTGAAITGNVFLDYYFR
jgi:hypothetical protein